MNNKYDEIKEKHQKIVDDFPMKFAFSDEQFNQSMKELDLKPDDTDKVVSIGYGYIKDMFVSELENHEYSYTHDLDETLNALELTREQVFNSPTLSHGLELAKKEVLQKESEVDYEYE